jgi:protein subunit release factor B
MSKELLFSVTASDCDWQYLRGTGPGGQKRNKTESKVRCVHRASGAVGESDLTRSQAQNKQIAFRKMAESKEFKIWHRIETARLMGDKITIEEKVDQAMAEKNLKIEGKKDNKWVPISDTLSSEGL